MFDVVQKRRLWLNSKKRGACVKSRMKQIAGLSILAEESTWLRLQIYVNNGKIGCIQEDD